MQQCSHCQVEFTCGTLEDQQSCWCADFPAIMPVDFSQTCRCPSCLAKAISDQIDRSLAELGQEKMIELAQKYSSSSALKEGIDFTLENGNMVFSKWYHLKRGSCCNNGCRHCPYDETS